MPPVPAACVHRSEVSFVGRARRCSIEPVDEIAWYNQVRWAALVEERALFTRPALDLDAEKARCMADRAGMFGGLAGKRVLCLAGGGGQQSAAFSLLGAKVTVFDLTEGQLARDQEAAAHYGYEVETIQGDMRDLSVLPDNVFDIVFHPHSLNFVPDARVVFSGVGRVIKPGGFYFMCCANPFYLGMDEDSWNGAGYTIAAPYVDGAESCEPDSQWMFENGVMPDRRVPPCRVFRHALSSLVGGLSEAGFRIVRVDEFAHVNPDTDADPGSWDHFTAIAPPWISFWSVRDPVDAA